MKPLDLSPFKKVDSTTWYKEAQNQLKSEDVFAEISWNSFGLNGLKPYYDAADLEGLSDQLNFFRQLPSHTWKLFEKITVINEKEANRQAVDALLGGCDGIIFNSENEIDSKILLKGIDLSICEISVNQVVDGASGMNATNCLVVANSLTPSDQIKSTLDNIVASHEWIHRQSFSDFFIEIATIRALRYLLTNEKQRESIKIHSSVLHHPSQDHQWFLNTTAGLASILGGSYSIDMTTASGNTRISRNVGNIIREESGINQYEDQCGGAYYIEALTNSIIKEALSN